MARPEDDALVDAHVHGVPPGLPGLHAFPAILDGPVETVAAAVRAELAASGASVAGAGRWPAGFWPGGAA